VQNNAEFFNFDGAEPAEVTIADIQALFQDYIEQRWPRVGGHSLQLDRPPLSDNARNAASGAVSAE
ncbi:hypothetical protein BRC69_03580, partial [Halobacteriales archaeon QH_6_66_25]